MSSSNRFEVIIEKIVAGGDGLGRHQGKVVFVPQAAPGDRLCVEVVEHRRDYIRAEIVQILTASTVRREPPCPFFGRCGGCSMMHLAPDTQIEAKREILLESLRRGGGVELQDRVHVKTGPELGYRSRARFHVKYTGHGPLVGFKERGSHRIVDVNRCLLISDEANGVLGKIRRWIVDEPNRAARLAQFEILQSGLDSPREKTADAGRILVHFVVKKKRGPSRAELEDLLREGGVDGLVVTEEDADAGRWRSRLGCSKTMHRVGDIEYQATVGSFFQVNRFLLNELVDEVLTPEAELEAVVDLYCGVGLFSLPLARRARFAQGVESSAAAISDARENARRNGLENVDFVHANAGDYVARVSLEKASLVLVDPPRGGLERPVGDALVQDPSWELRYVSCDPAAWGRDAGRLTQRGFELQRVALIDLFPNTHHFETVTTFRLRTG
jgi:23S rRNA (uracil1939-C5)-methyltransferase